ncbi:MAG: hypothetical protein JWR80_7978 [Bradyrhizobium sp.]|nr:hypothetical protein [Bradyrhizobium sp.]
MAVMNMCQQIIAVSDAYAAAAGIGRKRTSTIVLKRGSKLDDIASGGDLNTQTFERAMKWFSDNWPSDAVWPDGVPRFGDIALYSEIGRLTISGSASFLLGPEMMVGKIMEAAE